MGDVLQAKTVLLKDQLSAQRAVGDYQKALAALANGVGAQAGTVLNLSEYADPGDQPDSLRLAPDWLDFAQRNHPAIVSAQAQLAEVEKRAQVARSEGLPSVDLTGSHTTNGTPGQALSTRQSVVTTLGVVLNVPLFDGFSRTYKLRGALAQVELQRAQLSEAVQQVLAQISQAHADAQAARLNLGASAELLTTAELSAATAARRYEKGAADIQELLGTQAALLQARQERLRCLVDWRSAYRQLLANAGVLGRARAVSVAGEVLQTPALTLP
jgi:outer membrane protein